MKYFKPEEICEYLTKEAPTKEEKRKYDPPCFEGTQLLTREYGGFARVPLRIPESINIFVSPMGCARHCEADLAMLGEEDSFYRMTLTETEIINGNAEKVLCDEVDDLIGTMKPEKRPRVVTITITCIDGLLCTDYSRTGRMLWEKYRIRFEVVTMFPILGDNNRNHGAVLMESLYALVQCPEERRNRRVITVMGSSEPLSRDTDFFLTLKKAGYEVRQIHECKTLEDYDALGEACLNVVINKHSVSAAKQLKKRLGIPYIEFFECFYLEEIYENYKKLEEALGVSLEYGSYYEKAKEKLDDVLDKAKDKTWAVGGRVDYDPAKFMYDFTRTGFQVKYILARRFKKSELKYYEWYRKHVPDLMIYTTFDMEMMNFFYQPEPADLLIGAEDYLFFMAPDMRPVDIGEEPYDFETFCRALERIENCLEPKKTELAEEFPEPSIFDRKWMRWEMGGNEKDEQDIS